MKILSVSTTKYEQYLGWFYFVFQMLILPDLLLLITGLMGLQISGTILNVIFFSVNFLFIAIIFRVFLWESAKHALKKPFRLFITTMIGYALYWFLNFIVFYFILIVSPQYQNINDATIDAMAHGYFVPIALCTIFLVPVTEEVIFRGLIFHVLFRRSKLLAYAISSAAFSLIHLVSYIGIISPTNFLIGFIQYLPAGIALGYAYEKADSIYAPIMMHMFINAIGMFAMR